jgi:hypothetical protein
MQNANFNPQPNQPSTYQFATHKLFLHQDAKKAASAKKTAWLVFFDEQVLTKP